MLEQDFAKMTYDEVIEIRKELTLVCKQVNDNDKRISVLEVTDKLRCVGSDKTKDYALKIFQIILYLGMFVIALRGAFR